MKKFDEKFIWSLSAETVQHYTEEYLIQKIQKYPDEIDILKKILEKIFKQSQCGLNYSQIWAEECEIKNMFPISIIEYLQIKGFKVTENTRNSNITITW